MLDKPPAILLIGPTGSGKTPLGELIERNGLWGRCCRHFDFGAHLRRIAADDPPDYLGPEDVAFVEAVLRAGALLEDEHFHIAENILCAFIAQCDADDVVVLNGLPRHVGQAHDIDAFVRVYTVVELYCTPEATHERIRTNAGGDRFGRVDDHPDDVEDKLSVYSERTAPLLDHYRRLGVRLERLEVHSGSTPQELWATLNART